MCTLMQVTDSYNTVFGQDKPCIIDGGDLQFHCLTITRLSLEMWWYKFVKVAS